MQWIARITKSEEGFTLIEMMVVVGIISVLATVATPNVAKFTVQAEVGAQKAELRSVKTALRLMLAEQRIKAITSRSGGTSVNNWSSLPSGAGTLPLSNYLESPTTSYFYCYDGGGKITRQDIIATGSCP